MHKVKPKISQQLFCKLQLFKDKKLLVGLKKKNIYQIKATNKGH